ILYDVSRPINGDKAKVFGVELGVQHFFANGFGLRANYTFTDTKAYVGGVHVGDLEGVSESAYSVALMFENDRWDAQVAADYRGSDHLGDGIGRLQNQRLDIGITRRPQPAGRVLLRHARSGRHARRFRILGPLVPAGSYGEVLSGRARIKVQAAAASTRPLATTTGSAPISAP